MGAFTEISRVLNCSLLVDSQLLKHRTVASNGLRFSVLASKDSN
jgi:hypothetical protein